MRFFSSSALANAPKLRLAASCSAAETIGPGPFRRHHRRLAGLSRLCRNVAGKDVDARDKPGMTISLRGFLLRGFVLGGTQDLHGAAGLLDRRDGGFRRAMDFDIELCLDLAASEQTHAGFGAANGAGFHQRFGVDGILGIERLGVDRGLNTVEIDLGEFQPEDVGEAALRQAPVQRHLPALEPLDAHARARGLALAAATGLLALAGTDAAADTLALLARSGIVGDFAELHRSTLILFF